MVVYVSLQSIFWENYCPTEIITSGFYRLPLVFEFSVTLCLSSYHSSTLVFQLFVYYNSIRSCSFICLVFSDFYWSTWRSRGFKREKEPNLICFESFVFECDYFMLKASDNTFHLIPFSALHWLPSTKKNKP